MRIDVWSEVAPLQRVMVHRPGREIVRMTQYDLEPLLFDDILAADLAADEHDLMRSILEAEGAEVLEAMDLLGQAFANAPAHETTALVDRVCDRAGQADLAPILLDQAPVDLARSLVEGVTWSELPASPQTLSRIRRQSQRSAPMALPPVPNLMFTRDPCISIYDRVVVGRMATEARVRESLLVRFALSFAEAPGAPLIFDTPDWDRHPVFRAIEGGDVLVPSPNFLLIGCSERTRSQTIERLSREVLFPTFPDLHRVYAVLMPARRSVMHLDTVLTQIDKDLFLGHAPMIADREDTEVAVLERSTPARLLEGSNVVDVLREELGPVTLVPCGGTDPLFQRREQWTDGANAVCLAPGHILLYSRNRRTTEVLREEHGFTEVGLSLATDPTVRAQMIAEARGEPRVVYTFDGSELSRARGGARCMTMPLIRGEVG